jgi:hypothetical protein
LVWIIELSTDIYDENTNKVILRLIIEDR